MKLDEETRRMVVRTVLGTMYAVLAQEQDIISMKHQLAKVDGREYGMDRESFEKINVIAGLIANSINTLTALGAHDEAIRFMRENITASTRVTLAGPLKAMGEMIIQTLEKHREITRDAPPDEKVDVHMEAISTPFNEDDLYRAWGIEPPK